MPIQSDRRIFAVRRVRKDVRFLNADNNIADQIVRMPKLIRLGATVIAFVLTCSGLICDVTSSVYTSCIQLLYLLKSNLYSIIGIMP